jgi:hypothetical protein
MRVSVAEHARAAPDGRGLAGRSGRSGRLSAACPALRPDSVRSRAPADNSFYINMLNDGTTVAKTTGTRPDPPRGAR